MTPSSECAMTAPSPEDLAKAREIVHPVMPCSTEEQATPGHELPRWHSAKCETLTLAIAEALAEARREGAAAERKRSILNAEYLNREWGVDSIRRAQNDSDKSWQRGYSAAARQIIGAIRTRGDDK